MINSILQVGILLGIIEKIIRIENDMEHTDHISQDEGLRGNEKIEEAIAALQQELSADMLAHTLTVVRRRMREQGQFILALETPGADEQLKVRAVKTEDGKLWWAAFTSFEEELKGGGSVMSTFLTGFIHYLSPH